MRQAELGAQSQLEKHHSPKFSYNLVRSWAFVPTENNDKKLFNTIISFHTGQMSKGSTIVLQLFLCLHVVSMSFFSKMKKTKNRPVSGMNHISLYTTKPLRITAFQTLWLHLEVFHLLLRKNYQKGKKKIYHIPKPIFHFSNVELKKKTILQRELSNLHQPVVSNTLKLT